MTEESGPYWVDVTLGDEKMEEKIAKAMDEAKFVRMWAIEELTTRWQAASGFPTTAQLSSAMTQFIQEKKIGLQRYTALTVLNNTVSLFNRQVVTERAGIAGQLAVVTLPKVDYAEELELVFQARSVWKNYFFNYGYISTVYGSIYISEGWQKTLDTQVAEMGISWELFPYLWYGAGLRTMKGRYKLRFHAHPPKSAIGKRLTKKKKEKEKWG